jgi:glyoxylase-like metal-dependent hydrolase (beta-lactamase superfamily II)
MPFHQFTLGQWTCYALQDNTRMIDTRDEFPQLPENVLLEALNKRGFTDFHVHIGFNNLLIQTGEQLVLIDSGTGTDKLNDSLAEAGFSPDDINYLLITHSDFDHIGGMDHYKKARIVFPKTAYDLWTTDVSRVKMIESFQEVFSKFLAPDFVARAVEYRKNYGAVKLPSLLPRLVLVREEEEFLSGFRFLAAPGHRSDHFAVELTSDGNTLLHIADAWRHQIQMDHPDWYSIYDYYPDQFAESVALLLERAREKKVVLFGAHFEWPGLFEGLRDS